jgi:hypothetical protein
MGISHRRSVLDAGVAEFAWDGWRSSVCAFPGAGLLIDAVEHVWPVSGNKVDIICERERVQVGLAMEPFRPFVFPTIWTDEGARVTGTRRGTGAGDDR